jgi:hypothetical protein
MKITVFLDSNQAVWYIGTNTLKCFDLPYNADSKCLC